MNRVRTISFLIVALFILSACGGTADTEPTSTPGPPTAAPGQMTVADVIGLADDAWPGVTSMRTTSQSGPIPREGEQPPFTGSVQDWNADGERHIFEFQDGTIINEQIWVDGTIYMRGQFVSSAVAPELDVDTWVILDTTVVPEHTPVGERIRYLTREQNGPYGTLTEDTLARPVTEGGTVVVGDRSCTVYTFGDENQTGTEIRYEIAVDQSGLPCQLILRGGDFQNSTVFEFNTDITVEAPLDGTPVSGTPEG